MKVGLVRHFRVVKGIPLGKFITPQELLEWFAEYDVAEVEPCAVDLGGIHWERCFASDVTRAARTAEAIFPGGVVTLPALRETPLPLFPGRLRLPLFLWAILARLAMATGSRVLRESRRQLQGRAAAVLDEILACEEETGNGENNVLIVSHGGLMLFLRKELLRRGFRGPRFGTAENGRLYVFERESRGIIRQR